MTLENATHALYIKSYKVLFFFNLIRVAVACIQGGNLFDKLMTAYLVMKFFTFFRKRMLIAVYIAAYTTASKVTINVKNMKQILPPFPPPPPRNIQCLGDFAYV
jgi:hypothetical protein